MYVATYLLSFFTDLLYEDIHRIFPKLEPTRMFFVRQPTRVGGFPRNRQNGMHAATRARAVATRVTSRHYNRYLVAA